MSHRQVITFDKTRVDRRADWRLVELCGNGFLSAKDDLRSDRHHAPFLSAFDHLRIEQLLWRNQHWLARSSSFASLWEFLLNAVDRQQSVVIMLEFVRGEERELTI